MSKLGHSRRLAMVGDQRPIGASALDDDTVKQETEVTVWSKQVGQDELLFWGHGSQSRRDARAKFAYADLDASGNGAGAAGDPITGELVLAITDSDQRRVLVDYTLGDLEELADAASERPVMYALAPFAKPGRHIEIRVRADADSDDYEIDSANSSARLWYSVLSR